MEFNLAFKGLISSFLSSNSHPQVEHLAQRNYVDVDKAHHQYRASLVLVFSH
jgi:hypothetical protein